MLNVVVDNANVHVGAGVGDGVVGVRVFEQAPVQVADSNAITQKSFRTHPPRSRVADRVDTLKLGRRTTPGPQKAQQSQTDLVTSVTRRAT
jgi:hypothetical protein